jgi:hypothetical protein
MKADKTIDTGVKLSTLWIVVMVNMIFAITVELVYKNTREGLYHRRIVVWVEFQACKDTGATSNLIGKDKVAR